MEIISKAVQVVNELKEVAADSNSATGTGLVEKEAGIIHRKSRISSSSTGVSAVDFMEYSLSADYLTTKARLSRPTF